MTLLFATLLGILFIFQSAGATQVLKPPRITEPPQIDGELNDDVWNQALIVSDFLQRLPREGSEPTERSEMRVLYTRTSLYLGFRAFDSRPEQMVATVMKRDDFDIVQNDQLAFAIDSYNDGRNGYWFSTNPLGARVDAQFGNEGDLWEPNWNGIWNCKSRIDGEGWTVEIEIPFSTLRFTRAPESIMGINFFRRIVRTNEQLFAPLIPLQFSNGTPNVSVATKYSFYNIQGADHLFVKPYALSGFSSLPQNTDIEKDAGLDVRYQLTNSLVSNFSLNMDFAEADVDDRQVNLTRFGLFFPEKREFFLESAGNFLFGIPGETEVFFSRRIGLSENTSGSVPILFGAKLTGKIRQMDIGILNVQTQSESCDEGRTGPCESILAENFSVIRIRSGISQRSYLGAIITNRSSGESFAGQSYGADLSIHLGNEIFLTGFAATVQSSGDKADFWSSDAYDLMVSRAGERTSFKIRYTDISKLFQPAIGFVQRPDIRRFQGSLFHPYYRSAGKLVSSTPGYDFIREEDHDGNLTFLMHEPSIKILFQSEDQLRFIARIGEERVPMAFPIFRTVVIPEGAYSFTQGGFEISTKPGRKVSTTLFALYGGFFGGSRLELSSSVLWKANKHFTVSQTLQSNFVELHQGDFNLYLTRTRIGYSLNTNFSTAAVLQYDNSSQKFGMNFRAGYFFREGTEFFVVYGEILDRATPQLITNRQDRTLLIKLSYMLHF